MANEAFGLMSGCSNAGSFPFEFLRITLGRTELYGAIPVFCGGTMIEMGSDEIFFAELEEAEGLKGG